MRQLDELEIDALKEILNIGIGHAAESFSKTICSPVRLSVPSLELLYGDKAAEELSGLDVNIGSMVKQRFYGGFAADGVLVFPNNATLELVRLMVGGDVHLRELHELEQDALIEIGNILFNSSVSVISDMIGMISCCQSFRHSSLTVSNPAGSGMDCQRKSGVPSRAITAAKR